MNYIIHTPSAARLKQEILKRVEAKADANGTGIVTWQIAETGDGEKVLVHTADQWAEKGGIFLQQIPVRYELQVRFYYWEPTYSQYGVSLYHSEEFPVCGIAVFSNRSLY